MYISERCCRVCTYSCGVWCIFQRDDVEFECTAEVFIFQRDDVEFVCTAVVFGVYFSEMM